MTDKLSSSGSCSCNPKTSRRREKSLRPSLETNTHSQRLSSESFKQKQRISLAKQLITILTNLCGAGSNISEFPNCSPFVIFNFLHQAEAKLRSGNYKAADLIFYQLLHQFKQDSKVLPIIMHNFAHVDDGSICSSVGNLICGLMRQCQRKGQFQVLSLIELAFLFYYSSIMFVQDNNVVELTDSNRRVYVFADIHGQFEQLLTFINIAELQLRPNEVTLVFLGDIIDRGDFGVECVILLALLKLAYPKSVVLLRGNHETEHMAIKNFKSEVCSKFDSMSAGKENVFRAFLDLFSCLPIACQIEIAEALCVHGGLWTDLKLSFFSQDREYMNIMPGSIDDLQSVNRFEKNPTHNIINCALWSDPSATLTEFNKARGEGISFGPGFSEYFCKANRVKYIIRGHEDYWTRATEGQEVALTNGFSFDHHTSQGSLITLNSTFNNLDFECYQTTLTPPTQAAAATTTTATTMQRKNRKSCAYFEFIPPYFNLEPHKLRLPK